MAFADGTKAEDEAQAAFRRAGLIGMRDDARIEQRRRLERIFVQKIGADELPLDLRERGMVGQGLFHLVGACLEGLQQVAVTAEEILQHIGQLTGRCIGVERQNPFDDVVGTGLVRRIEVARLGCRLEGPHDHARRIGSQMKGLAVQERKLRQGVLWIG